MKSEFQFDFLSNDEINHIERYITQLENESWMRCHYADGNMFERKLLEVKRLLYNCKKNNLSEEELNEFVHGVFFIFATTDANYDNELRKITNASNAA